MTSVRFRLDGDTITFDDGGMNLLSSDALRELREVLDQAPVTSHQLLIFRSGRPNLFAAGADMAEMQRFTALEAEEFSRTGQELFAAIEKLPLLTIALIDGDCFGGALDLAMAFDLRFATPHSRFAHPGARLGIVTGFGGTSRWRDIVTSSVARRLFLGNEVLSSSEALAAGLVDRVTNDVAGALRGMPAVDPGTIRLVKDLLRHRNLSQGQIGEMAVLLARLYSTRVAP